jgi:hypothetical protein
MHVNKLLANLYVNLAKFRPLRRQGLHRGLEGAAEGAFLFHRPAAFAV